MAGGTDDGGTPSALHVMPSGSDLLLHEGRQRPAGDRGDGVSEDAVPEIRIEESLAWRVDDQPVATDRVGQRRRTPRLVGEEDILECGKTGRVTEDPPDGGVTRRSAYGRNVSPPRNVSIAASRSIVPRLTRLSDAVAVIDFHTDARMYGVSEPFASFRSAAVRAIRSATSEAAVAGIVASQAASIVRVRHRT